MERWLIKKSTASECNTVERNDPDENEEEGSSSIEMDLDSMDNHELTSEEESFSNVEKPSKKKREKGMYVNKFCESWLSVPQFQNWLKKSRRTDKSGHDLCYCVLCKTEIMCHKTGILRHSLSKKHNLNMKQVSTNTKIPNLYKISPTDDNVRNAELKLSALLATNNLSFSLMDTLAPLCKNIFPDSEIAQKLSLKRTKATALITNSLGKFFFEDLYSILQIPGTFFSIIMDETTDIGVKKQCAFTVIYCDPNSGKIVTKFFDMIEISSGKAEDLYRSLKEVIVSKNIPLTNLVGFSSDTTNVMVGHNNSVFSFLKAELKNIVCVKCSCHMIHLSASKACLKLPRSVEDLLRNLGSHFNRSHLRQERFREFQEFFKTDIHKILSHATTRWLSMKQCTDRVLEQYDPLKAYLRELTFTDPSISNDDMLKTIENHFTKIYLEFMSYTLELLNGFNLMFQSEAPLLHKLKPQVESLLKSLCSNFIDVKYIRKQGSVLKLNHTDPTNFVPLDQLYLGIQASESIQNLKNDPNVAREDIERFFKSCLNFYIEVVTDIKTRFDFSDPVFEIIKIVDPGFAYGFEVKSLNFVVKRFPFLNDFIDIQELDNEWKEHALLDLHKLGINISYDAQEYWQKIFALKNAANIELFSNLKTVINFLLVLPFSNASVERIFSDLKNIKTDHRNKLNTATINALIATKQGITNVVEFKVDKTMLKSNIWKEK
ncbi:uncharacterized protein LOC116170670 [Photinus pyralis]|uniref:HAT C-terminal dimerisation domain-containing protein n=3 Tax=Photinus pyralis TaxID=7054 RepID=A0A1Y1MEJ0_PHOPY|nr:uncharacterized protein LOC116159977 [Photinus pyralis]XP_031335061.1 uncharacterized protein LOC116164940 [Photinus pyralis]XP_031343036.1 uncharacterized protein LOC116170670 [Photinus pyralis]